MLSRRYSNALEFDAFDRIDLCGLIDWEKRRKFADNENRTNHFLIIFHLQTFLRKLLWCSVSTRLNNIKDMYAKQRESRENVRTKNKSISQQTS